MNETILNVFEAYA